MRAIELAFTGYPVTDMVRAREFYEGVLELDVSTAFEGERGAWIEYDIGPGTLAISDLMPEWKPSPGGGCAALEVDDFDSAIARLKEHNVPIPWGPFETPVCHMAVVSDPDGNSLIIHKRKAQG
jgi:predicted enzyme related to lactoylglutathione lyase